MPNNRNPIIQWEVTFPQSGDTDRDTFYHNFPPCIYAICAKEEHKDDGHHLHLGLKLKKGISHKNLIKWLESKYPDDWKRIHVSPIKSWENWNDYCHKEDPHCFVFGSLVTGRSREQRISSLIQRFPEMWNDWGFNTIEEFLVYSDEQAKKIEKARIEQEIWNKRRDDRLRTAKLREIVKSQM